MKTRCYSVRLKSLAEISSKAYLAKAYDGSSAIIPKSQVFGQDFDVLKSDSYWISVWILEQKTLQYSRKKEAWFSEDGKMLPTYKVETVIPTHRDPLDSNIIDELKK